jgi:hypothetical protein
MVRANQKDSRRRSICSYTLVRGIIMNTNNNNDEIYHAIARFLIFIIVVFSLVLFMAITTWFFPQYGKAIGIIFAGIVVIVICKFVLGK